jgi:asparagine synthase (glutamine-hydrolysing)
VTHARGPLAAELQHYDPREVISRLLQRAPPERVGLVNTLRYIDFKHTLPGDILVKVDRACMAVALEVRPVYLHRDVLALAGRIPPSRLADGREAKKALRSALRSWLPGSILDRPKAGFAMPLGHWLRRDLRGLVTQGDGRLGELLDPAYVQTTARTQLNGNLNETARLHSLLFIEHWLEKWQ